MNIVNKLTLRTLKENKRRTLVTIIGVIISVAMITAVSTIITSFMDLFQRQEIADNGEWHVLYKDVNLEQLEGIKQDDNTETTILSRDVGYSLLEGSKNDFKPYLYIKEFNLEGFKNFPIHLIDGRLPMARDEIIISEHIEDNAGIQFKIGDTLEVEVGERIVDHDGAKFSAGQNIAFSENEELINTEKRTYTIVGIMEIPNFEYGWSPGYTVLSYIDESTVNQNETFDVSVILKNINRNLYDQAEALQEELQISAIDFNSPLLRYYGVTNNDNLHGTIISISAILMLVIMVGSISLIYNAFAISVSERSRYLGMLSSVGATKKQKQNSVFFEGAVIGLISIPLGIIAGIAGIGITLVFINNLLEGLLDTNIGVRLIVTPVSILVAILVSFITIFISTFIPARRASRITAIDAIRQTQDVKLTNKKVKTPKLVRKLFGFEGELALKNLKRNKKRYQATVFSLVISIILFLTVSYFTQSLEKSFGLSQNSPNYDLAIHLGKGTTEEQINQILSLEEVAEFAVMRDNYNYYSKVHYENLPESLRKIVDEYPDEMEKSYDYNFALRVLSDESLEIYAEQIGIDLEILQSEDSIPIIVINQNRYQEAGTSKIIEEKVIHAEVGHEFEIFFTDWETNEDIALNTLKIVAFTEQPPLGIYLDNLPGSIDAIITEEGFDRLIGNKVVPQYPPTIYINSDEPDKIEETIIDLNFDVSYIYNVQQSRQESEKVATMLSIFVYGFITLITLITVANIFNTISTSIALRKREFAMLKSVGMTPQSFNKMINFESIFYGIKSLTYGLPLSIIIMFFEFRSFQGTFVYQFELPWISILVVILAVFIIVGTSMAYSTAKVKKENIIDALKQENI